MGSASNHGINHSRAARDLAARWRVLVNRIDRHITAALATMALMLVAYAALVPAMPHIEGKVLPVTSDTEIRIVGGYEGREGWTVIEGSAVKERPCNFEAVRFYLGDRKAHARAQLIFLETTKARPQGRFAFGQWAVQLTPEQLRTNSYAIVKHSCHWVWPTYTTFYEAPDRHGTVAP